MCASTQSLASMGRGGDTELAHVNPQEKAMLIKMGGSGTTNPETGLKEYRGGRGGGRVDSNVQDSQLDYLKKTYPDIEWAVDRTGVIYNKTQSDAQQIAQDEKWDEYLGVIDKTLKSKADYRKSQADYWEAKWNKGPIGALEDAMKNLESQWKNLASQVENFDFDLGEEFDNAENYFKEKINEIPDLKIIPEDLSEVLPGVDDFETLQGVKDRIIDPVADQGLQTLTDVEGFIGDVQEGVNPIEILQNPKKVLIDDPKKRYEAWETKTKEDWKEAKEKFDARNQESADDFSKMLQNLGGTMTDVITGASTSATNMGNLAHDDLIQTLVAGGLITLNDDDDGPGNAQALMEGDPRMLSLLTRRRQARKRGKAQLRKGGGLYIPLKTGIQVPAA